MQLARPWARRRDMSIIERETDVRTTLQLTAVEGQGVPRGVAYVSSAALEALGCAPDDVVRIEGSRPTVARVQPAPDDASASDSPSGTDMVIQMDGLVRQNAGAALGDVVSLT